MFLSGAIFLLYLLQGQGYKFQDGEFPSCGDCWCIPGNGGLDACPTDWQPVTSYNESVIAAYKNQKPLSIYKLDCNPYKDSSCTTTPKQTLLDSTTAACAYKYSAETNQAVCTFYEMITYESSDAALADGAVLTHAGSCGVCSTAQDLAIYLRKLL